LIDLHLHTTASDGMLAPAALVERAQILGIKTLSVTDHDTMAGVPEAAGSAATHGLEFLPGVEITAVHERRDVHVLAYFLDPSPPGLEPFLAAQREDRRGRARKMSALLAHLGAPIDVEGLIAAADAAGQSVARPLVARALVDAAHVADVQTAFDRWLADGKAAYVPREGASPADVVRLVSRAGGITALAHPGLLGRDELIPSLAQAGLGALEVYHSEHDTAAQSHYAKLAAQHGLAVCGGSDFHGDGHHRAKYFGQVSLPREAFMQLLQLLLQAHSVVHGES
jgi:predicted metal-dependent phosphoesterase TrpH